MFVPAIYMNKNMFPLKFKGLWPGGLCCLGNVYMFGYVQVQTSADEELSYKFCNKLNE